MLRRAIARSLTPYAGVSMRMLSIDEVPMPALSPTMEKGNLAEWKVQVGAKVEIGDPICAIETDKATNTFESPSEGYVARLFVEAGTANVKVGQCIALIVDEEGGVAAPEVMNYTAEAPADDAPAASAQPAAPEPAAVATPSSSSDRVLASPFARKTASELGVDLSSVQGTGGSVGRITSDDVRAAKETAPAVAPAATPATAPAPQPAASTPAATSVSSFTDTPASQMRRVIADRLTQSKNVDVPHYYETCTCKIGNMQKLLKHLNAKGNGKFKISVNDFIIKAVARANMLTPACNTHWHGEFMRQYHNVDVSVAVATPTGLITPIVKNAHLKGLAEISIEMKELAGKAREGTLMPQEYQGGTVSVSNLGGLGIDQFTAIINPPQSTILAVGTAQPKAEIIKNDDGEWEATGKIDTVVTFTASFDHRVVDGAVGAEWFKHFKDTIENPLSLLL